MTMVPADELCKTEYANKQWQQQHEHIPDWADHYWQTRHWASRDLVINALSMMGASVKSVLELGCHVGPMLERIVTAFPNMRVSGMDTNSLFVSEAKQRVPSAHVEQGNLMTWLPAQPTKGWDVVLTHYSLAYVAPRDLDSVLYQCLRIARRGLIVAEPTGPSMLIYPYPEWQHDYPRHFMKLGALNLSQASVIGQGRLNKVTQVLL